MQEVFHLSKNNHYKLDHQAANDMLQNILKSCEIKPNDIPLNTLQVRHSKSYFHLYLLKGLCVLFFLITLFCPIILVKPSDKIVVEERAIATLNILDHRHEGDYLYFLLNSDLVIDPEKSYMITDSGNRLSLMKYDVLINEIAFLYPDENTTIYIYTTNDKLLKLYLKLNASE